MNVKSAPKRSVLLIIFGMKKSVSVNAGSRNVLKIIYGMIKNANVFA